MGAPYLFPAPAIQENAAYTETEVLRLFRKYKEEKKVDSTHFWEKVKKVGTPLVEKLDSHYSRAIFLYRNGSPKTKNVVVTQYGLASFDRREWEMTKIPGTDVWYLEKEVPVGTRLVYAIQENTPMIYMADSKRLSEVPWAELISHAKSDPFNKSPYPISGKFVLGDKDVVMSVFYHPMSISSEHSRPLDSPRGQLVQLEIPSQFLPEKKRNISIYIPVGYDEKGSKNQRLLVIFDGDSYLQLIPSPVILDNMIHQGLIPKTIALFIKNPDPNPTTRIRDLILGEAFYKFLTEEMMPWMRERYAFNPAHTVVAGSSAGGWAAAYAVLNYPKLFPNALCQSPAMAWPIYEEDNWLLNRYVEADLIGRRFFIDVGVLENAQWQNHGHSLAQSARALRDILKAKGVSNQFIEFPGGHDYISWEITFAEGLKYLLLN